MIAPSNRLARTLVLLPSAMVLVASASTTDAKVLLRTKDRGEFDLGPMMVANMTPDISGKVPSELAGSAATLDFELKEPVTIEVTDGDSVTVAVFAESEKGGAFRWCRNVASAGPSIVVDPTETRCTLGGSISKSAAIVVRSQSGQVVLLVPNRRAPFAGSDLGIGLTIVDRWNDGDAFGEINGVAGYYSLSKLRNRYSRLVAQVSFLDDDPEHQLEVGLGVGVLLRTTPSDGAASVGFALAVGVGKNLMLRGGEHPWFTFVGLTYNFETSKPEGVTR